jgi:hypothetical protein
MPAIPKIFHRTVRELGVEPFETYWSKFQTLHPGWEFHTYTGGDIYMSGLTRLLALIRYGGIYVDWDIEPVRSWEPLLDHKGFSSTDAANIAVDAVLGAVPNHPALRKCLDLALYRIAEGGSVLDCSVRVTNTILPYRSDWTLLPTESFYYLNWLHPERASHDFSSIPGCYAINHTAESWFNDPGGFWAPSLYTNERP